MTASRRDLVSRRHVPPSPTHFVPPAVLPLLSCLVIQLGSAGAKELFFVLGPAGIAFLRSAFAALLLLVLWRPALAGERGPVYRIVVPFGLVIAAMNLTSYLAIQRLPLGIAVTIGFLGSLAVAVAGSRRVLDVVWVVLAGGGVLLLTPVGGLSLDPLGIGVALLFAVFSGAYILLAARTGLAGTTRTGLTMALAVAGLALAPLAIATAGTNLLDPRWLAAGAGVAVLSSAIPYSLELEALRQLPPRVFGVLLSTEPAIAALVGYAFLHQALSVRSIAAVILVSCAAAGVARFG